jgi:hypothetical protein
VITPLPASSDNTSSDVRVAEFSPDLRLTWVKARATFDFVGTPTDFAETHEDGRSFQGFRRYERA